MVKKIYTHDKVLMKLFQKFPGLGSAQGFKLAMKLCHLGCGVETPRSCPSATYYIAKKPITLSTYINEVSVTAPKIVENTTIVPAT